jgi:GTPase SAR1 family protein
MNKGICSKFSSVEEFYFHLTQYHKVRNILSHPASREILISDFNVIISFIKKLIDTIPDNYFWYTPKDKISNKISDLFKIMDNNPLKKDNLSNINLQHKKLVCREEEIEQIDTSILGKDSYQRVAGSIVLFGYGGVGKTALIIDYIYKLIGKLIDTKNTYQIDFILFFSSKDEYLRSSDTTGELYIDTSIRQIDSFHSLEKAITTILDVPDIESIQAEYRRGIIVIDNIENLESSEKDKIYQFIKRTPRTIQYVITSRNEEPCEEKIHVKEFRELEKGKRFIEEFIINEPLIMDISESESTRLVEASKGNTLILVQSLLSIGHGVCSVNEINSSLESVRTKKAEIIADFMYKNTFERAIKELEDKAYNPKSVIVVISLYGEPIELYSISKLCNIDLGAAEEICHLLTKGLILMKKGEYYSLNEFANSFIFIKLLPDRFEINNIKSKIRNHKKRMDEKIRNLDLQIAMNSKIKDIMEDWKPKNYIDKIVIAESFALFTVVSGAVKNKDRDKLERALNDFREHELVSNHPYIQFQKARLYRYALRLVGLEEAPKYKTIILRAYEDSIESIEFDYPFIRGTSSHGAVLMLFGIFLATELQEHSRAIRYLEEAKGIFTDIDKNYFLVRNYLALSFRFMFEKTNDRAYRHQLEKIVKEVLLNNSKLATSDFDMKKFKKNYSMYQ